MRVAERAVRYIKKRLDDKPETDTKFPDANPVSYWAKHYKEAADHHNKENVQATTNMTPENLEKPENKFDANGPTD